MPITTNANRVKDAGYWCDDADAQTDQMLSAVGANWSTEIPIVEGLKYLGLSNTLLALGAPRPKYKIQADLVLVKYIKYLMGEIKADLEARTAVQFDIAHDLLSFNSPDRRVLRASRAKLWMQCKYNEQDPYLCLLYGAMATLLSEQPLQIKAIYATKDYLSVVQPSPGDALKSLKDKLKELLDAAA